MATTVRIPATAAKAGSGATSDHKFKFGVGAAGAVTAATLKQAGDGVVRSVVLVPASTGRYTVTINAPAVIDIINCKVTYAKAAQTDAEVFGHYKVGSLTTGAIGTAQTFEIFFATSAAAAANVPSGSEVMVEFTEVLNKTLNARVDN
jgi:hypothetical protein